MSENFGKEDVVDIEKLEEFFHLVHEAGVNLPELDEATRKYITSEDPMKKMIAGLLLLIITNATAGPIAMVELVAIVGAYSNEKLLRLEAKAAGLQAELQSPSTVSKLPELHKWMN